ncbi:PRC-barrel domain-containing protein [Plastorhodobacter daqingensis]|uniref:PRC-barrel domain-containing protein n=1 Tax=Plastorhodobacter daqingensis TaxID=1387281 RepID=A0ABW2UM42_9RHOB
MLRSLSDTLRASARAEDTTFPLRELFLDPVSHRVRYVALDAGRWFETVEVIVAARLLRPGQSATEEDQDWVLDLTPQAVEAAPRWTHGEDSGDGRPLSVEHWPPVVVGPFGHTTAPLMVWAQMSQSAQEMRPPHPPAEASISVAADEAQAPGPDVDSLDRATGWLGKPVFGTDGELGVVADIGFDADSMRIAYIVVDNDKLLSSRQAAFPLSALRHRAGAEGHFVLDARTADMETAPSPEELGLRGPGHAGFFAPV